MARTALQKTYADFRQGFVTVANPLAYPEGALKDIVNLDIKDNGTLALRPGLQYETNTTVDTGLSLQQASNRAFNCYVWLNVEDTADKIAVIQVGPTLYFYNMLDSGIDLDNLIDTVDTGIPSDGQETSVSVASGNGPLFVTHPSIRPFYLTRLEDGTISDKNIIDIKIRDTLLWRGPTDRDTGVGFKQPDLRPWHEYNMRNAGWPEETTVSRADDPDAGTTNGTDPLYWTRISNGWYPGLSVPFFAGKSGGGTSLTSQNAYSPWAIRTDYFGNSFIPRGKFIVNAADWERDALGYTAEPPEDTYLTERYEWTEYPSSVEFYAGRVWYAGAKGYRETVLANTADFETPPSNINVAGTIYFSQQIGSDFSKTNLCYQENDPTSEELNALLPTDGGTLTIRGIGEVLDIRAFKTSLIIFGSNGIWAVSGVDANSFKADSFSINKLSNIGPSSSNTITASSNIIYYISNDAIYAITQDNVTGLPTTQDITSGKIKDFFNSIPFSQKARARLFYDTNTRNLFVFYADLSEIDNLEFPDLIYNRALVFNQDLGAFYKYAVNIQDNYILDGLYYNKDQITLIEEPLVIDDDPVVIDGEPVVLRTEYSTQSLNNIQLLTVVDNNGQAEFTFSSFTDINNRSDWGVPYEGSVEFGFESAGDILRDSLKAPAIVTHMERTEDGFEEDENGELQLSNSSGCLMSYGWDWSTSYKNPFQIYRFNRHYVPSGTEDTFDYGVDVITTRNRIRGKGQSLGIRLQSEPNKDMRVLGIGVLYTAAQRV